MEQLATLPTVTVESGWETVVEGKARAELERVVLPEFLRQQRWFGGKGRRIASTHFADWTAWRIGKSLVFPLLLEVRFADDKRDFYFLPLGVTPGADPRHAGPIARLFGLHGTALLHDAADDEDACLSLLAMIGDRREWSMNAGRIVAFPTAAFASLRGDAGQKLAVERGPATSSNTLIFYGDRLLMKLFRRLESGINPDFEVGRFLTEGRRFDRIPQVGGAIEYHRANAEPITLAILQARVANRGDGWRHALDELSRYYPRAAQANYLAADKRPLLALADATPPPAVSDAIGDYLLAAATLGQRTAEMHRALSADAHNPAFAPEPFAPEDSDIPYKSIREQAENTLSTLRDNLDRLPSDVRAPARQLLDQDVETLPSAESDKPIRVRAAKIRCHGDYHLGQVLRVDGDYVILDFEGEPVRTVAERRAKQSPLKDVAGMLRSYHYAAYAGLFAFAQQQPDKLERFAPFAELWFQWVSAAFLRAYREAANGAAFWPAETTEVAALLDAFLLDKAFYELNYELNNRPDWVRIPLRGILTLLEKGSTS
jgi:maltose alpha-D-glucosyltransferase/alpha-amylase